MLAPAGWSLYGAPWLQLVAINGKSDGRGSAESKPKSLPSVATGCREKYMVSRASAVGCHPLREAPFPEKEGVDPLKNAKSCEPEGPQDLTRRLLHEPSLPSRAVLCVGPRLSGVPLSKRALPRPFW
jgi:hypothetical protein